MGVCKFIGYKTCGKFAGLYVGKRALTYGASYVLGGILPMRLVKCVVAVAPYTPAAVVLATGGTSALVANTTYIVISQLSEYVFVCAVRRATWAGARATLRIAKYVFVTRPLGLNSGPLRTMDAGAGELLDLLGKEGMEEGWVLVDEESEGGEVEEDKDLKPARGAIAELMRKLKEQDKASPAARTEITEEMVELSLLNVGKIAKELTPEEAESGVEFVDEEGVVFEEAWDKTVEKADSPRTTSPHPEDQEFVMV
eukprot:Phypoly_transcript_14654.p1 GENE.Phypoly_transcript_14654~~Phypoly_transcript_14654.p1  ORF type:complete len:292 (+),score=57.57 Phypoly_transcript_14654:112-876(+)